MSIAAGLGKRMDSIAIDDKRKGFPYTFLHAGGHGFSGLRDPRTAGTGRNDGRREITEAEVRWKKEFEV